MAPRSVVQTIKRETVDIYPTEYKVTITRAVLRTIRGRQVWLHTTRIYRGYHHWAYIWSKMTLFRDKTTVKTETWLMPWDSSLDV